jgi:hypothetical protein
MPKKVKTRKSPLEQINLKPAVEEGDTERSQVR